MKIRSSLAVAASLALLAAPAYAQEAQFRSATPQAFSAAELQQYGLAADDATRAIELQEQGYTIVALTPEEAEAYQAGITQTEWILIGIGVLIILAIA
ncbi:MAG: hypothetical protein AB7H66_16335 [Hyphomonadaceae bacterium]